ncbi:MAG: hypothetical protein FWF02_09905 [Micrococcales bacterium]|nr:hypothetical protein [Micrococcales bacterium]MCL2668002.1 hypothetical protein [Micrococcales bacterium]
MAIELGKMSALELAELERLVSEADELVAQWCAAAPCPEHRGASLRLGALRLGGPDYPPTRVGLVPVYDPAATIYELRSEMPAHQLLQVFGVTCCVCGRITGTFVDEGKHPRSQPGPGQPGWAPNTTWWVQDSHQPYQPGQSAQLAEIRALMR